MFLSILDKKTLIRVEKREEEKPKTQAFQLDHLLDIVPKRLYINSKFKCKIYDVIDENGEFWLEILYGNEDELKFNEIIRLLRLSSRISDPPRTIYLNKRVSALYKNEWYRAIIVDDRLDENLEYESSYLEKCRVRFMDLGIRKMLDTCQELREVDDKFFVTPSKALKCTVVLNDSMDIALAASRSFQFGSACVGSTVAAANQKLKFTKEARKLFTKLIYNKVLFAKVIE
jgi:hypothetical protein